MSLPALRQAAFSARRTYTVGGIETKRPDGSETSRTETRTDSDDDGTLLEPHWQASIESATD